MLASDGSDGADGDDADLTKITTLALAIGTVTIETPLTGV